MLNDTMKITAAILITSGLVLQIIAAFNLIKVYKTFRRIEKELNDIL